MDKSADAPPPPGPLLPQQTSPDEPSKNVLFVLFSLFCPKDKPLQIDDIARLSLDDELRLLRIENIDTATKRRDITSSLFEKVPDLKLSAHKRIRFKSILSKYSKSSQEIGNLAVTSWDSRQLAVSLFSYLVQQLLIDASDEASQKALAKDRKQAATFWKFAYYTHRYCEEKAFDGAALYNFWNEHTAGGTKTGGFQLKFIKLICAEYDLKFGKFASVKKKVNTWFTDAQHAKSNDTQSVKQPEKPPQPEEKQPAKAVEPAAVSTTSASSKATTAAAPQSVAAKPKAEPPKKAKPVSTMARTDPVGYSKWYWMDCEERMAWVPYTAQDQELLHAAYGNGQKSVDVVGGKFRVEFASNGSPAGDQHNTADSNAVTVFVVRSEAVDGHIHTWPVADTP